MNRENKRYKVSVIIATYNTGKYIAECLESIFEQTLKELEIIIVDDGSTDDTQAIVERYRDRDKALVYYYQVNQGAGPARNYGIDIANGEYLAFMDPDDKYPNNDCLERLYEAAQEHKVQISAGNILANDHGTICDYYVFPNKATDDLTGRMVGSGDFDYLYGHTRYLYQADFVRANEIYFLDCKRYQDQIFTIKALCLAKKFYQIDYPVYEYRINYKKVNVTYEICFDIMRGFYETLVWICEYHLERMFHNNYVPFVSNYLVDISKYINCGHEEFDDIIKKINQKANSMQMKEDDYLIKSINYYQEIQQKLKEILRGDRPIIIYGAGYLAQYFIKENIDSMQNVVGIAVTAMEGNVSDIEGIEVKSIEEYNSYQETAIVLITPERKYRDEIISVLVEKHFVNYYWGDIGFLITRKMNFNN